MYSRTPQRQRSARMSIAMLLAVGLLSSMAAASPPAVAQDDGQVGGTSESVLPFRTFEFGAGTLEERGDYIHCVARATSSEGSKSLVFGRETCFREESEASEFARAGSAVGAQFGVRDGLPVRILAVHYAGLNFTGGSLRALGTECGGGGYGLRDTMWDNVFSSTVNGCAVVQHYDVGFVQTDGEGSVFYVGGTREDTTGLGGDLDVLDNRVSGIVYTSPSSIAGRAGSPVVNLVGLEVTQGVQNWMGTLELVRNKQTAVRAFFETPTAGREVEVAATLRAHTTAGVDMGSRMPVNSGGSVTVSDDVAERRWRLDSSLNFVLELDWSNLGENDNLILSLDFADNITVNCRERIVPARSCSANVSFLNVPAPDIVMVPLEAGEAEDPDEVSFGDLMEQLARINSVMPFSSEEIDAFDVDAFIVENYTFDSRPFARDADPADIRERLLNLRSEVNDDAIYLGVLPGEPDRREVPGDDDRQVRTFGSASRARGVAYWFTSGIDGGFEADAHFGHRRNVGSHELGHLLGQTHTARIPNGVDDNGDMLYLGACDEPSRNTDLYVPFEEVVDPETGNSHIRPVLGPLGDVDTEVWGLDIRYVNISPLAEVVFYPEQISTLAVSNPRRVFSIMSYCEPFREDHEPEIEPEEDPDDDADDDEVEDVPDNQGLWMDAFHHERIIDGRREAMEDDVPGVDVGPTIVISDMFSGRIEFSDTGAVSSAVVGDVFSRPRDRVSVESGDYVLELRNASGEVVSSVSFDASAGIDDRFGSGPYLEPTEAVFSFVVSDPPEYSSFAVKHDDGELLVVSRSASAPSVSVSGPSAGQFFGAGSDISVSWSGSDADGDELSYRVYYSVDGGKVYMPLSLETANTSRTLPADRLRGSSRARIGVSVSDGARSSFVETPVFSVANHAPEVSIRTPVSGDVFAENQGFVVEAVAYDMEDGLVPSSHIVWGSSIDGSLGAGRYLVLSAADLTAGSHTLTVTATDSLGVSASASVDIVISLRNALPVANDDNFQVSADEEVLVDVLANDVDVEGDVDLPSFRIVQSPLLGFAQKVRTQEGVRIKYYSNTSGRDNFSYIICDAVARCDTARVSIDVGLADCTVLGTDEDDTLEGTSGDDVICGLGGDDTIDAKGGDDVIRGGLGDDTIYARAGNDVIYGEIGNDFILGHNGSDTIYGGLDDDTIYGGGGADAIFGGHGQDRLYGEADDDTIEGGGGADIIHGGRGDDTIRGGDGDDTIRGNDGADTIESGKGTDTLLGVSPEDTITETA